MNQPNSNLSANISSGKYPSTKPSGTQKDKTTPNQSDIKNNKKAEDLQNPFSYMLPEYSNPRHIGKVVVNSNPEEKRDSIKQIETEMLRRRSQIRSQPNSTFQGASKTFFQEKQRQTLRIIQNKLDKLNLKVQQNEGHGIPFQENTEEIPLWLLCRGNYS